MAKTLCIDCDRRELRIVVGNSGLTGVSVEQLLSTPVTVAPQEDILDSQNVLSALQSLLKQANARGANTIVTIPRSSVELRTIQVPSADKNELPEMVRFAAQRHFTNVGDNWPIDFITLGSNADGMTEVLASSMSPTRIERIHRLLESNGLKLQQLVLRPMVASAVALLKRPELKDQSTLFVDVLADEADMAIVDGKHVVFMRTIRFDADQDPASREKTLGGEVKRTLLSAASQSTGLNVSQIILWGSSLEVDGLCEEIGKGVNLPVSAINPLELVDATQNAKQQSQSEIGKYAAAIGGLLAPIYHENLIDFAHPRKREERKLPIRKFALLGAAATLLIGLPIYSYFSTHWALNAETTRLTEELSANEATRKAALEKVTEWSKIESFLAGNYNWLDELTYFSKNAPPPEKAIFNSANFAMKSAGNAPLEATISTSFVTSQRENTSELQDALRDDSHSVESTGLKGSNSRIEGYPFTADLTIRILKANEVDPRAWPDATKTVAAVEPVEQEETPSEEPQTVVQDAAVTSDLSTAPPSVEEPATETPATETPATEAPATETPATETPATEAPVVEPTDSSETAADGEADAEAATTNEPTAEERQ